MDKHVVMVALTALLLPLVFGQQDYCTFTYKHTMCGTQVGGPACGGNILRRGVSSTDIQEILDTHNRLRARIARGEEKRGAPGPQPSASNMRMMEWDDELAVVAQRHADQCKFAHDCSECRKVTRFGVGQNLYIAKQSLRLGDLDWKQGITDWYDEVTLFSRKKVQPFQFAASYGHYSQLVWADTYKIGCGVTSYREGKWFANLYTCNYGPNGNFIKGQMYKQGSACSECDANQTCSRKFPGLCESRTSSSRPIPTAKPAPVFAPKPTSKPVPVFKPKPTPRPTKPTTRPTRKPVTRPAPTPKPVSRPIATPRPITTPRPIQTPRFVPTKSPVFTPVFAPKTNPGRKNFIQNSNRFTPQQARATVKPTVKPRRPVTSTPTSSTSNSTLFYCGFETQEDACKVRSGGSKWIRSENYFDGIPNHYFGAELAFGDQTEFFFENLITPPPGGVACLDFRYKKFSTGDSVPLTVMAWPFKGKPGRVNILRDSPDPSTWIRAQVTFRNIENYFLIMLRGRGPQLARGRLQLAVDDLTIRTGQCDD